MPNSSYHLVHLLPFWLDVISLFLARNEANHDRPGTTVGRQNMTVTSNAFCTGYIFGDNWPSTVWLRLSGDESWSIDWLSVTVHFDTCAGYRRPRAAGHGLCDMIVGQRTRI